MSIHKICFFTVLVAWSFQIPPSHAIDRISDANSGAESNDQSFNSSSSDDGRFTLFNSRGSNLITGDTNNSNDIFLFDRTTGTLTRISLKSDGTESPGASTDPELSSDAGTAAFSTQSSLLPGDANNEFDVYLRNLATGLLTRASVATNGTEGNGQSQDPSLSADGTVVAFESGATNLDGADGNGVFDVFVRDRSAGTTRRISRDTLGGDADGESNNPKISGNGRFVVFDSAATDLVPNDTNGARDIFVFDLQTNTMERVSVNNAGTEADFMSEHPDISHDGRYVVFESDATNLDPLDGSTFDSIYCYDRLTDTIRLVSVTSGGTDGAGNSNRPRISSDGNFVVYESSGHNIVPGDNNGQKDIFVFDKRTNQVARISVSDAGAESDDECYDPAISGFGNVITFRTAATTLVTPDTNTNDDVFLTDNPLVTVRPDLRTGPKSAPGSHKGNNVYNLSGGGQVGKTIIRGRQKRSIHLSAENDGNAVTNLILRLLKGPKSRDFKYKAFRLTGGKTNVKSALRRGDSVSAVAPGGIVVYRIEFKGKGHKARYIGKPELTASLNPAVKDVNKLKTIAKP